MADNPYRKPPDATYTMAPPGWLTTIPEEIILKDHVRLHNRDGKLVKSYDVAIKLKGEEGIEASLLQAIFERPFVFIG